MAKIQTKYQILREYSESDVKALGMNYIYKKRGRLWMTAMLLSMVFAVVGMWVFDDNPTGAVVSIFPFLGVVAISWWSGWKTGKKILAHVKTHPQPVKLDF